MSGPRQTESTRPLVSPFELKLELGIDEKRSWPAGLPAEADVLMAIGAQLMVDDALEEPHQRVLKLLPERLYQAVCRGLVGLTDAQPVASATASAWRVIVGADRSRGAVGSGVDQPALLALIDEATAARETLVASNVFALDVGASAEGLLTALTQAIEVLVHAARFKEQPKVVPAAQPLKPAAAPVARMLAIETVEKKPEKNSKKQAPTGPAGRLKLALAAGLMLVALYVFSGLIPGFRKNGPWVVVGDPDHGKGYLVPGYPGADEAQRSVMIKKLEADGVTVTYEDGEWVLERKPRK